MDENRIDRLTGFLRNTGLANLAAAFLENAGLLTILAAQALYAAGPVLAPLTAEEDINELARLLENPAAVEALARKLAEEQ